MRRTLLISALGALVLGVAACSSGQSEVESTTTTTVESTTTTQTPTTTQPPTTTLPAGPTVQSIHVSAQVDGRSLLVIRGNEVGWAHIDWAAPGRHQGSDFPTMINGEKWFPVWPDTGDPALLHCNCESDFFDQLDPSLPEEPVSVSVDLVIGRGLVCVEELPTAENGWTLIVDFDDNSGGGPVTYYVILTLESGDLEASTANDTDCVTLRDD